MTSAAAAFVEQGRAAYQAGAAAFQAWMLKVIPNLSLAEWQTLVINIVGWRQPLTPSQRQLLNQGLTLVDLHRQLLILLLRTNQIQAAQTFARAICQTKDYPSYFLSPSDIEIIILNTLEQVSHPADQNKLCEFLLELNPYCAGSLLHLLEDAVTRQDEFSILIYCQAIAETVTAGFPFRKEAIESLLKKIYALNFWDSFFILGTTYAKLFKTTEQEEIYAALALIALQYLPEFMEELSGRWNYQALIKDDHATEMIIGLQAYLPANQQLTQLADNCQEDEVTQLQLYGCAVKFQGIGGYFHDLRENLNKIANHWTPERLELLAQEAPLTIYKVCDQLLFRYTFLINYLKDDLISIRSFQNRVASLFSQACQKVYQDMGIPIYDSGSVSPDLASTKKYLKVGYLSHTFRRHSVGFISVESLGFHDKMTIRHYLYNFSDKRADNILERFVINAYLTREIHDYPFEKMVQTIRDDKLDILIYLDVLTSHKGVDLMAMKLAPIQIAWLGGDSPGIPEIDGFLVDPDLLPEDAQEVYPEQLLRLPTFVAVGAFDVIADDPKRFRQTLGIPEDGVIYVTAAIGYKRNPEWIECQLEIIRQVDNAYLIVKGIGDLGYMTQQFQMMADQRGIGERIRFLAYAANEESHRGQMSFMDIMLDTFPYTGATHTLECLWLGVPVLTCVGQHYYSRMSYAMLRKIGEMDACIADSAADYIAKGIALGRDPQLRARIKQRLWETRYSSLLWDPYRHCQSLEAVYRQLLAGQAQEQVPVDWLAEVNGYGYGSAREWNQAGITLFRQGRACVEVQERIRCYQQARECWRLGLVQDPYWLPCAVNRLLILWYLGYGAESWQAAGQLAAELWRLGPDLAPWKSGDDLAGEVIWIPSSSEFCPDRRCRYLHLLCRWQVDYFSIITNPRAALLWESALTLNPQDQEARLAVALNLLYKQQVQGLFHLYSLCHHPRAQLALALASPPTFRDPGRHSYQATPIWMDYAGSRLYLEPRLESVGTVALLARGDWFEGELDWLRQYLQPGMTVIDVGANVGVYTVVAARHVGPSGRVWAIEPTPACIDCLQKTVAENHLSQVQVIAAAAGDSLDTVTLRAQGSSVFNQVRPDDPTPGEITGLPYRLKTDRHSIQVPQIPLDHLWQEQGSPPVHVIKIDTEGSELKVLQGSQKLIQRCRPVLIVEIVGGPDPEENFLIQLGQWFQENHYELFFYLPGLEHLRPVHPENLPASSQWGAYNAIFNLIALPSS
ncbi:MAG: FkbM family methyltransferase [Thermostichales cyanobacterium HHBFW_bins_127]